MLCQSCGRPLPPGAQFCGECGAQVGAPSSSFGRPESPTVPEGHPVQDAVLPPSPPLADPAGGLPPPPVVGGPPPEFVAGAPRSGNGRRTALVVAVVATVIVAALVGLGFALARSGGESDEDAAAPTTVATVPEAPPVTAAPTTVTPPTTVAPPTTGGEPSTPGGEPSDSSVTVEDFCASAEELGALLQDAVDDPFGADPTAITDLSARLSEQAAELTATATPEELERISECTEALSVTP